MWKKLRGAAPILSTVVVAACVMSSLSGYTKPVYAVEEPEAVIAADAESNAEVDEDDLTEETVETVSAAAGAFDVEDGTYEGEGTGYAGKIRVAVTVKDKTITGIEIVQNEADTASFFERAKAVIDSIIQSQSFDVDTVSGATYSSRGIINAVKNALTNETDNSSPASSSSAGGSGSAPSVSRVQDPSSYKDGTYYGSGTGFAGSGSVNVKVVVSGGKIASAEVTSTTDTASYMNRAKSVLSRIVSTQSTNVDTVSGATYSSAGIIEAVRNALRQAAVTDSGSNTNQNNTNTDSQSDTVIEAGKFPYPDGIYTGIGEGFQGTIKVGIVIQDKTLKNIIVTETEDDEAFFNRAKTILDVMLQKQTSEVDTVSGATFSSNGLIEAVNNALEEAKKAADGSTDENKDEPDPTDSDSDNTDPKNPDEDDNRDDHQDEEAKTVYRNGSYVVTVPCNPDEYEDFDSYNLTMTVVIENDQIVDLTNASGDGASSNNGYIRRAMNGMKTKLTGKISTDGVDTVSGATCTSVSILNGVQRAIEQARN